MPGTTLASIRAARQRWRILFGPAMSILQRVQGASLDFKQQLLPANIGLQINHFCATNQRCQGLANDLEITGLTYINAVQEIAQRDSLITRPLVA